MKASLPENQVASKFKKQVQRSTKLRDLAIDLGTANTLIYSRGQGIIYNQPSVIAFDKNTSDVLAIGNEAWEMIGRTASHIQAHRPMRHGAITDYDVTRQLIQLVLKQIGVNRFNRVRALVCIPSTLSPVERQAVSEAASQAGVTETRLIEQPLAAAIGSRLSTSSPVGNMIVDIGGGTSESALISMGKVMHSNAVRIGSFDFDSAIQSYIRKSKNFAIGERTAEDIKIFGGSATGMADVHPVEVRGRDMTTGLPQTFMLDPEEVRDAIAQPLNDVVNSIYDCLGDIKEDFAEDLIRNGIHLAGGGSLLKGLNLRLQDKTEIPVKYVAKPLECVVTGAGRFMETENAKSLFSKSAV